MTSNYTKAAAWVGCFVALIIGATMLLNPNGTVFGGNNVGHEEIIPWGFGGGLQIGPQSQVPVIKATAFGTCNLTEAQTPATMGATTTMTFNCQVPSNVYTKAGDIMQITLANGHASTFGAFDVVDAIASSTAAGYGGIITVTLLNNVGVATSSFQLATTSASFELNRI